MIKTILPGRRKTAPPNLKNQSQNDKKILNNSVKKLLKAEKEIKMSADLKMKNRELSKQTEILKSEKKSLEAEKNKLLEEVAQLQSNFRAQPEKRKPAAEPKKKFKCSECGGINSESDAVCSHCGAKFE